MDADETTHARMTHLWENVINRVERELESPNAEMLLRGSRPVAVSGGQFYVEFDTEFARDWIEARHFHDLQTFLNDVAQEPFVLRLTIEGETPDEVGPPNHRSEPSLHPAAVAVDAAAPPSEAAAASPRLSPQPHAPAQARAGDEPASDRFGAVVLNPRYSFDTFVVGSSNRMAHAASLAVAAEPANAYNPLFLYGGVGLGKTHLMQAIGHYVLEHHRKLKVVYVSTERFTNELIHAIATKSMVDFRAKYRTVDVLLIDDIQFVAGKESTQEEFFHTFNTLFEANKQIVIASDRPPKEIPTLEERLRSRFEWGLTADVQAPDLETRVAILNRKAQSEGFSVSDDVLLLIANHIDSNIRELEGALIRVMAYGSLHHRPVDLDLATEALKEILRAPVAKTVTISAIQEAVADHFGMKVEDMMTKRRNRSVAYPRQIAMYLARELTDSSLPKIGEEFGGRDHTTVMHAIEKIKSILASDPAEAARIRDLINEIKGG